MYAPSSFFTFVLTGFSGTRNLSSRFEQISVKTGRPSVYSFYRSLTVGYKTLLDDTGRIIKTSKSFNSKAPSYMQVTFLHEFNTQHLTRFYFIYLLQLINLILILKRKFRNHNKNVLLSSFCCHCKILVVITKLFCWAIKILFC